MSAPLNDVEQQAFVDSLLAVVIYQCEFECDTHDGEPLPRRRSDAKFRRELITEAKRFEDGIGDRGGNPKLAAIFAQRLRERAARIPKRGSGRPSGTSDNPAAMLLDRAIPALRDALIERGRRDLADKLLERGKPNANRKRGTASGLRLFEVILTVLVEKYGLSEEITTEQIRGAIESRLAMQRRAHGKNRR